MRAKPPTIVRSKDRGKLDGVAGGQTPLKITSKSSKINTPQRLGQAQGHEATHYQVLGSWVRRGSNTEPET